mmetsp:Transcript_129165/g.222934  ORF Transcript_129165/g.222934 Transcript_129165/m.222934 type:complete len:298 (-) Transcript_129165:2722-3615(-)
MPLVIVFLILLLLLLLSSIFEVFQNRKSTHTASALFQSLFMCLPPKRFPSFIFISLDFHIRGFVWEHNVKINFTFASLVEVIEQSPLVPAKLHIIAKCLETCKVEVERTICICSIDCTFDRAIAFYQPRFELSHVLFHFRLKLLQSETVSGGDQQTPGSCDIPGQLASLASAGELFQADFHVPAWTQLLAPSAGNRAIAMTKLQSQVLDHLPGRLQLALLRTDFWAHLHANRWCLLVHVGSTLFLPDPEDSLPRSSKLLCKFFGCVCNLPVYLFKFHRAILFRIQELKQPVSMVRAV